MTGPQSVQEVYDTLRRDRLVEPARLSAFAVRHELADAPAALKALVADGLLTAYQAAEVAAGNGPGLWLGNYRVLERIGRGGMGQVFLAENPLLGKRVAVKVLSAALRADPGARRRFVREARAAAALDHPNIVAAVDVDVAHNPPYLVMEYVDGVSLQEAVARGGTFGDAEAACVAVQVADGLARAASVGLVHRDIKPANVLIDRRGAVKILDLGIVKFGDGDTYSRLNGLELIVGTLDYLAPEQALDSGSVDTRADLYALGGTLYFLLTGHPPYPGNDVRWKIQAKQTADPHPLERLRPDLPPEMASPADRYATPGAVAEVFRAWAVPAPGFPARLFCPSDSTARDRHPPEPGRDVDPLPDTLRINKASLHKAAAASAPVAATGAGAAALAALASR
jgi:serine/threonine protein kinase